MEAHPIPQNVTAFQFHLVGDMTLKQFLYLLVGVGIAYLVFVLFSGSFPVVAWPITFISAILGVAFAFIPISDRPLDYWLGSFLKAVYSPTYKVWSKNGKKYNEEPQFFNRLLAYYSTPTQTTPPTAQPIQQPVISNQPQPQKPMQQADLPSTPIQSGTTAPQPVQPPPLPTTEELQKTVELAKEAQTLQTKIIETERELNTIKTQATAPHANPQNYGQEINQVMANLQKLFGEAAEIKRQIAVVNQEPTVPKEKVKVTVVPPSTPKQTQIVLTSLPNVINGIIRDAAGNYLENVVVVIYDKEGLPVRALKTNKLGQFSGSTPLPNGTYNIELEKDNLVFDTLQIELEGKVLPALAIMAKKLL